MTGKDEIVDRVREAREAYASRFDFDITRILHDLRIKEQRHADGLANLSALAPIAEPAASTESDQPGESSR
jgi:hypothetical protein